jgi:transcriptional regulator with AAA-type ATPase domain
VVPVVLPPLRERPRRSCRWPPLPAPGPRSTPRAEAALRAWHWPGNVRELQNVGVKAAYFFAWQAEIAPVFRAIWPRLPGFSSASADGASFWAGADEPGLEARYEPHALLVDGVVTRADWDAWHTALLAATSHLPRHPEG